MALKMASFGIPAAALAVAVTTGEVNQSQNDRWEKRRCPASAVVFFSLVGLGGQLRMLGLSGWEFTSVLEAVG